MLQDNLWKHHASHSAPSSPASSSQSSYAVLRGETARPHDVISSTSAPLQPLRSTQKHTRSTGNHRKLPLLKVAYVTSLGQGLPSRLSIIRRGCRPHAPNCQISDMSRDCMNDHMVEQHVSSCLQRLALPQQPKRHIVARSCRQTTLEHAIGGDGKNEHVLARLSTCQSMRQGRGSLVQLLCISQVRNCNCPCTHHSKKQRNI